MVPYKDISKLMPRCPKCKTISIPLKKIIETPENALTSHYFVDKEMGYKHVRLFKYIDIFCPKCFKAYRIEKLYKTVRVP